jgi:hypothetical protein
MTQDHVTNMVATVGIVSPWLLEHANETLSITLSVSGLIWILVQIYYKIKNGGK